MSMPEVLALSPDQAMWLEQWHPHTSWRVKGTDYALKTAYYSHAGAKSPPYISPVIPEDLPGAETSARDPGKAGVSPTLLDAMAEDPDFARQMKRRGWTPPAPPQEKDNDNGS